MERLGSVKHAEAVMERSETIGSMLWERVGGNAVGEGIAFEVHQIGWIKKPNSILWRTRVSS